jgi:two-component system phosphate regulon sensor histidine kinase PhoR
VRPGVRGRLFVVSLVIFTVVGAASAVVLELRLRTWLEAREELHLGHHLAAACVAAADPSVWQGPREADALADALGAAFEARVTFIAPEGRVLGDSDLDLQQLAGLENHGQRPEVQQALTEGRGFARRHSDTLGTDMLYLAAPLDAAVVRVALPLAEVDRVMGRLRLSLLLAVLVGLGLSAGMSGLAAEMTARTLRGLVLKARGLARGEGRIPGLRDDEISSLASSIDRLGAELEARMAELAAERARFGAVLDGIDAAVLVLDEQRRVSLANASTARVLGLGIDPRGHTLTEICRVPELISLVRDLSHDARGEVEVVLPDRGGRTLLAQAVPQRGAREIILVIQDITRLRRLEKVRRDFVANVSHELRTPVSVVRANTETLLAGALDEPEQARIFLDAIQRNTERMGRLVSDLLDLSRLEAGQVEMRIETTDLHELARRVLVPMQPLAAERETALINEVEPDSRAQADPRHLEQVLTNLLDNAVKYTPTGSTVRVSARLVGGLMRLEVRDDGPGIEPKHVPRLFERFYRVDKGRSRADGGTGLGLAIVKHMVGAMGGRVGAEAALPRGMVFWVELPVA